MVHLLGFCDLNEERSTFIEELCKICKVSGGLKNLKNKHIMGIQVVLDIISESGNYLNSDWKTLLSVVSHVEFLLNGKRVSEDSWYH